MSESEDDISELRSYESAEYESGEMESEEVEIEIEESDNDIEVMKILAEAQKQNRTVKQSDQIESDRDEHIKEIPANNTAISNVTDVDMSKEKVCIRVPALEKARNLSFA